MENTGDIDLDHKNAIWFVALGESWLGPLTAADLHEKVSSGQITLAHFAWKSGQSSWKRIYEIRDFDALSPVEPKKNLLDQLKASLKPKVKQSARAASGKKSPPPPPSESVGEEELQKVWYVFQNQSQSGPFSGEEIKRFLEIGKLHSGTFIWTEGMDDWAAVREVEAFGKRRQATKSGSEDQRVAPRRPLVARILLANQDSVAVAMCRDISVGGMQVLTSQIPGPVGTRIKLNVSPAAPDLIQPFTAEGVIVRILEDGRGFSFRFDKLPDSAKKALESYVS